MADGGIAGQALDHPCVGEVVAHQAEAFLGMEAPGVIGDDARSFLAAMLKGVKAERRDGSGIGVSENTEDTTLFMQAVGLQLAPEFV